MQDFDDLMKMAQQAQEQLLKSQEALDHVEVEGVAGGGMVKVRATAKGHVRQVEIDDSLFQPGEKQMVEDLVAAAFNDARAKADQMSQDALRQATGNLPLPPGFKMPF